MTDRRIDRAVHAEFVTSAARFVDMPADRLPEVAVMGRSNVGKSSLINALVNRRNLARTSGSPGKTQTINFYLIEDAFYLVDLPGLGYAKVSKTRRDTWGRLIRGYLREREALSLVIHLVDSRHSMTDVDLEVASIVRECGRQYVIALTKTDKLSQKERASSRRSVEETLGSRGLEIPIIATSAVKKTGIVETWEWIETFVGIDREG